MAASSQNLNGLHFNWAPGIGDPTFGGWLTVALYFLAALSCWITLRKLNVERGSSANEQRVWVSLSALMLALGVNKQLDVQTAFTEAGRLLAYYQGWHNQRQSVQVVFIGLVALACVVALIFLLVWSHKSAPPVWLALSGAAMVLGFVLIRAASFHHVDSLIGARFLGVRWNHLIEIGGITVILWASLSRQLDLEIDLRLGLHHREWTSSGHGWIICPVRHSSHLAEFTFGVDAILTDVNLRSAHRRFPIDPMRQGSIARQESPQVGDKLAQCIDP